MGEKGAMVRSIQRSVTVAATLIAGLIPAATGAAAPLVASSARAAGQAATSCSTVATIPVEPVGNVPTGAAVNPRTNKIYVVTINSSPGFGPVAVISGRTSKVVARVHVSFGPSGVAVNPRTNKIYVANTNQVFHHVQSTVSVISGRTNKIYVTFVNIAANLSNNSVLVISGRTSKVVATIPVRIEPGGVAVNPRTRTIYVAGAPVHVRSGVMLVISGRT